MADIWSQAREISACESWVLVKKKHKPNQKKKKEKFCSCALKCSPTQIILIRWRSHSGGRLLWVRYDYTLSGFMCTCSACPTIGWFIWKQGRWQKGNADLQVLPRRKAVEGKSNTQGWVFEVWIQVDCLNDSLKVCQRLKTSQRCPEGRNPRCCSLYLMLHKLV